MEAGCRADWGECGNSLRHDGRGRCVQDYRLMKRYAALKGTKGSGKAIIATARKLSHIVGHMLTNNEPFNPTFQLMLNYENIRDMRKEKQLA